MYVLVTQKATSLGPGRFWVESGTFSAACLVFPTGNVLERHTLLCTDISHPFQEFLRLTMPALFFWFPSVFFFFENRLPAKPYSVGRLNTVVFGEKRLPSTPTFPANVAGTHGHQRCAAKQRRVN